MKKIIVVLFILTVIPFNKEANALLFNPGDSGILLFSSLPLIGTRDPSYIDTTWIKFPLGSFAIKSDGTFQLIPYLSPDDSYQINIFEDQDDLTPMYTEIISGEDGVLSAIGYSRPMILNIVGSTTFGDLLWEDLEGKMTLTMLSGSMELDSLNVEVHSGDQIWGDSVQVSSYSSVPEPTTIFLLGLGLVGIICTPLRLKKRTHNNSVQ